MVGKSSGAEADSFIFKYALSASAATVAETVTYPLDLTKTRLQIQGERSLTGTAAVPYRGMIQTASGIVQEEGLLKLWQGVTPALYRHIVYTGSRMTVYEVIREKILGKNEDGTIAVWKAVLGGISAGAIGQLIASPTDLVKVQMQMDGLRRLKGKQPRFKNTAHAFRKIVHHGGVKGLWSGVVPNVQRAALVNMGDMATYDTVKHQLLIHTSLTDNYVTHTMSSGCSGLVAAVLGTPADVVKTRVMNQKRKQGKGVVYKSSLDCLLKTVNQEGFWALYKGFLPIWARMAPWSLTFWLTYEQVRKLTGASSF